MEEFVTLCMYFPSLASIKMLTARQGLLPHTPAPSLQCASTLSYFHSFSNVSNFMEAVQVSIWTAVNERVCVAVGVQCMAYVQLLTSGSIAKHNQGPIARLLLPCVGVLPVLLVNTCMEVDVTSLSYAYQAQVSRTSTPIHPRCPSCLTSVPFASHQTGKNYMLPCKNCICQTLLFVVC